MFDDIKNEATDKLLKIKLYLNEIKEMVPQPPIIPSEFVNTLKGLFFVYLYGVFEMVVTKTIGRTVEDLNASGSKISECKIELVSLILSSEYDALYGAGENSKWPKRWNISKKLKEDHEIFIMETIFPTDGKNIRQKQLQSLATSFGNDYPLFPRPEIQGYLEELVQNRNYIAHGDKLPQEIGMGLSVLDLEKRLQSIDELCTYIIDNYEFYIQSKGYLKA